MAGVVKKSAEDLLIEAGHDLFWKFGFRKVNVEDVCKRAGVSKMSFYRYFSNKSDLAKKVLDNVISEGMEKFREIMADDDNVSNKMNRFIALKIEGTNNISKEFISDVYGDIGSEIQQHMAKISSEAIFGMLDEFKNAQARGVFRSDFKPELLFALSNSFVEMMKSPALNALYSNPQELIVDMVNLITHGIAPNAAPATPHTHPTSTPGVNGQMSNKQ